MHATPMTVVETPFFLRKAADLLDEEERSDLVLWVGANVAAPESAVAARTRATCLRATSYESVEAVVRAYNSNDREAMAGLVERGRTLLLSKGTAVVPLSGADDHVGKDVTGVVRIESGRHTGEKCYVGEFIAR